MADTVEFFRGIFKDSEGYMGISWPEPDRFHQRYFKYPDELALAIKRAELVSEFFDAYFCAHLLTTHKRKKEFAVPRLWTAWADLDECHPSLCRTKPTYVTETSPGRYQAYWVLDKPYPSAEVELLNHKISADTKKHGGDNGYALTKLLRVPNTLNHKRKYQEKYGFKPVVKLVDL